MKRILLSLFLVCWTPLVFAKVNLQLTTSKVQMGETFSLNLTLDGAQVNSIPDLTPLQRDFTVVGTERSMSYTLVNGRASSVSEWTVFLTPKRSGVLTIPALQIGQERTAPTTIEVMARASSPGLNQNGNRPQPAFGSSGSQLQQQQDVLLEAEVSESSPYVNQQVVYTVRLYTGLRLLDASYVPPSLEDALLVPFGEGRRYQIMKNNRVYAVEEQQFALFPQKSGELKIKPPTLNALIYEMMPRRISVQAKPITLKVKAIPSQFKGQSWLPAKQVTLSESYDRSTSALAEGSTLVRTVVLQAVAVPAELLPNLDFGNSKDFNVYPEKPIKNNEFKQQNLVGTTTIKVTYLLNKAGQITIPALTVPWFNTVTGKEEQSTLPAFTINVIPVAGTQEKPREKQKQEAAQLSPEPAPAVKEEKVAAPAVVKPAEQGTSKLAWWLAGLFALAWLLTLLAWYFFRSGTQSSKKQKSYVLAQLQEACQQNKATQARDALLKWGRLEWPEANLLNLIDLQNLVSSAELKEQINQLSQALYHDVNQDKGWQGEALWQCLSRFKQRTADNQTESGSLPPIHRL